MANKARGRRVPRFGDGGYYDYNSPNFDESAARGTSSPVDSSYTPYNQEMRDAIAAIARAAPKHNDAAKAPAFQPVDPNDPYYQRSDISPLLRATNRDVMGGGKYGIRGFANSHPLGMIGALAAVAAGGAALTGGFGGAGGALSGGTGGFGPAAGAPGMGAGSLGGGALGAAAEEGAQDALPEIIVSGTSGGMGPLGAGLLGAGVLGAGALAAGTGGGSAAAGNPGLGDLAADEDLPEVVVSGAPSPGITPIGAGALGAAAGVGAGALGGGPAATPGPAAGSEQPPKGAETGAAAGASGFGLDDLIKYIRGAGALSSLLGGSGSSSSSKPGPTTQGSDVLPTMSYSRERTAIPQDLRRYGMGPEHAFFQTPSAVGVAPPPQVLARGGGVLQRLASPRHFVSHGTGAGGREDNIDAKLSENEYVIDAETVALLGDGSPEAGAKKLDQMRAGIRAHKGKALAAGKISPDAGGALQYLAEGGKVGALRALFRRRPPVDPNANLRRINGVLEDALRRKPAQVLASPTAEELAQDVENLRREVGAQGGDTRPLRRAGGGKVGTIEKALGRPPEGPLYHVIDRVTKEVMSKNPMSLKIARRRADGLDNAHGSYRYTVRRVGDDSEGGN